MANKMFGNALRELRKKKGYTQQQAANLLGLKNKSTLGSWEVGKSEPDGYTLLKLCKIYGVSDIYSAFGEASPAELSKDTQDVVNPEYISMAKKLQEQGITEVDMEKIFKIYDMIIGNK